MRRKKKGYSLLMAIQAILVITILAAAMVTLATASYRSSIKKEQINKLKLAAESGVEKQFYNLKEYIINNPIVLVDSDQYVLTGSGPAKNYVHKVNETVGVIKIWTEVTPEDIVDTLTGRSVKSLKIVSHAQEKKPDDTLIGRKITVTVHIDKDSIHNEYFESIFKNTLTTSPSEPATTSDPIVSTFTIDNKKLHTSGNMFLQGTVTFKPSELNMTEGNIRVKTVNNGFQYNSPSGTISGINRLKDAPGSSDDIDWTNKRFEYLYFCDILDPTVSPGADEMAEYTSGAAAIDTGALKFLTIDSDPSNVQNTVTYKVKSSTDPINFQKLINGDNLQGDTNGIYYEIVEQLKHQYSVGHLLHFGEYYKVLLVDGDLTISDDDGHRYNNYIIYCSGTVKFEGRAFFYNSNIFAKNIEIAGDVVFNGVNTRKSLQRTIGGTNLVDFHNDNKGKISTFLLKNLDGYGDFLKFRVIDWKEE